MANWIYGNRYLEQEEMENNSLIIADYLTKRGWSLNAIAGMLGNMESESTINPAVWQNLDNTYINGGYGLVQWTPSTNYTEWANDRDYPIENGYYQLQWIDEETVKYGQWIPTSSYPLSFSEFKISNETPEYLASAFLKNFERAGVEVEESRRIQALYWYNYISENPYPDTPDIPITPSKRKSKYNFILFNQQRRMNNAKRRIFNSYQRNRHL